MKINGGKVSILAGAVILAVLVVMSGPAWTVQPPVSGAGGEEMNAMLAGQKTQVWLVAGLSVLAAALFAALFLSWRAFRAAKGRAAKLALLNKAMRRQTRILSCINKSNLDGLLLLDAAGRIEVCNPAFIKIAAGDGESGNAKALAYALDNEERGDETAGKISLQQVFPGGTGAALASAAAMVLEHGKSVTVEVPVPGETSDGETENLLYRVAIHPFVDDAKTDSGSVAIFTDITRFRRAKIVNDARQAALVSALGRAIESVDENLIGHSEKMVGVAELLAQELDLDTRQMETLRIASRLSQIGKIFVPREILVKKEKLTPEELEEVKRAPEYADKALRDLHFDLPVRETVREMGMPCGDDENGEEISLCGRILSVVNAFVAMTSTRAWRAGGKMNAEQALEALLADIRFDSDVVKALALVPHQKLANIIGAEN